MKDEWLNEKALDYAAEWYRRYEDKVIGIYPKEVDYIWNPIND